MTIYANRWNDVSGRGRVDRCGICRKGPSTVVDISAEPDLTFFASLTTLKSPTLSFINTVSRYQEADTHEVPSVWILETYPLLGRHRRLIPLSLLNLRIPRSRCLRFLRLGSLS